MSPHTFWVQAHVNVCTVVFQCPLHSVSCQAGTYETHICPALPHVHFGWPSQSWVDYVTARSPARGHDFHINTATTRTCLSLLVSFLSSMETIHRRRRRKTEYASQFWNSTDIKFNPTAFGRDLKFKIAHRDVQRKGGWRQYSNAFLDNQVFERSLGIEFQYKQYNVCMSHGK